MKPNSMSRRLLTVAVCLVTSFAVAASACGSDNGGGDEAVVPVPTVEAEPTVVDEAVEVEPTPDVEPTAEPEPTAAPTVVVELPVETPEPTVVPVPTVEAEPAPTASPTEEPAPEVELEPEPEPEPTVEPVPEPTPTAAPTPVSTPAPEPDSQLAVLAWFTDPTCRFFWRLWDGQAWTATVANDGVEMEDALLAGEVFPDPVPGVYPDSRGDGFADRCRSQELESAVTTGKWFSDPTCRYVVRWWDGSAWTAWVGEAGEKVIDPLSPSDFLVPPPGSHDGCSFFDPPDTSAEGLGCTGENPACAIGDDGQVSAVRIMSHSELVDSKGFSDGLPINPYTPNVSLDVALGHITDCLRSWDDFIGSGSDRYKFTASPVMACNAIWRQTAYAVNHLGVSDIECVMGHYEQLWLFGGAEKARRAHGGWAGPPPLPAPSSGRFDTFVSGDKRFRCSSWLDPFPDRDGEQACIDLGVDHFDSTGSAREVSRDPDWEEWGVDGYLRDPDGNITAEWWKPTYCIAMVKCIDLITDVAPETPQANKHNSCDIRFAPQLIFIAARGRCGTLDLLQDMAELWGGKNLPNAAPVPGDQIVNC